PYHPPPASTLFPYTTLFRSDKSADQDKNKDKEQDKSKTDDSGFGGTLTTKSSKKTTDTATLGFKGVGPDGYVDPEKLKESPNGEDRKSTRLNSSHRTISYAV